ncbi:MAG: aldo/keto reductase [Clostridiales bacterium]|jgi:predicted aldo/keto reductase-like oxidoreductase|nr:aldo/keto reductase [Clostridiales bacterium]
MRKIRLGKTGLMVTKTAFGVLPLQRTPMEEAVRILQRAYDAGINYYDTANAYTDSEIKIGAALSGVRHDIVISTKTGATDRSTAEKHIDQSLMQLKTDYIDLLQLHNIKEVPDPSDEQSAYAAAMDAVKAGKVLHVGVTSHRIDVAEQAVDSGLFETVQFPFSYIGSDREIALAGRAKAADVGFIAMKGLAGGMLTSARACYCFIRQFDNVVPIWGMQHMWELEEFLALDREDPQMDDASRAIIEKDRAELLGSFCRSCGYCLPCPAGIDIPQAARMERLLRRAPSAAFMSEEYRKMMHRIDDCIGCNHCKDHCPYELDTPNLLKYMLDDYDRFYAEYHGRSI